MGYHGPDDDDDHGVGAGQINTQWWRARSDAEMARDIVSTFDFLEAKDRYRQSLNLHHLRLYGNLPVSGVNPSSYSRVTSTDRITMNVVSSVCDLATARIGKQRPAPKFLTQAGSPSLRRRARLLERFMVAQFRISDVYAATRDAFLDGTVFGTGVLKIFTERDDIIVERVFPSEILVDSLEGLYGKPRTIFQSKWISKEVLRGLFEQRGTGKDARQIEKAIAEAGGARDSTARETAMERDSVGDQVLVIEAWHLPSGPKAGDGRHCIVTDAGFLLVEEHTDDYLPFLFLRWKKALRGFWGVGLAEELTGIQVEINTLLMKIKVAHKRLGNPYILIDARSKLQESAMTNEIGSFVKYVGNPPIVVTNQTIHPEIYAHLDRLYQRAFDLSGMSQDTATPETKSISGISAQTQHEIGTERFAPVAQDYETMHLKVAKQIIDRAKEIASRKGGDYALPAERDRNTISSIAWKDVDMKMDEYIMQILPASSLPNLPGPRMDRVVMMLEAGMIDIQTANELLDFPDLEAHLSLARAASENIDRTIENILDEGIYEAPEPFGDLVLGLKKAQAAYNKALSDGVEEDRLQMLRSYMVATHRMVQKAQVEQMKATMAAAGQNQPVEPGPGSPPAPGSTGQPPGAVTQQDGA